jgi:sigma-B regulation protein RsbU (phosphoserine phosphatase)
MIKTSQSIQAANGWEAELERVVLKYHIICCWIGIILDPLFGITDYFNVPGHFIDFISIRFFVAGITAIALVFRARLRISAEMLALFPVLGIALQNAYMYSVMDIEALQKHTFAYIALFIGAGMLVLWRSFYTILIVVVSILANIAFFYFLSPLSLGQALSNGGLLTFAVAIFSIALIQTRFSLTKKELIARFALKESNEQLSIQKELVEEKNRSITDSINYAKKIQEAILPHYSSLKSCLPDSFILFKPKDIISGDFYWLAKKNESILIAAADCTGHGVPGSLMSMLGNTFLNEIVNEKKITQPAAVLFELRERITSILKQNENDSQSKDGMDIALCKIDTVANTLVYSGAFNPMWIIRNDELIELKANKFPIGVHLGEREPFIEHSFQLKKGDCFYLFTDGYADQFGGPSGKKFMYKNLFQLLASLKTNTMDQQKIVLDNTFSGWRKNLEQVDDILIIGVRV